MNFVSSNNGVVYGPHPTAHGNTATLPYQPLENSENLKASINNVPLDDPLALQYNPNFIPKSNNVPLNSQVSDNNPPAKPSSASHSQPLSSYGHQHPPVFHNAFDVNSYPITNPPIFDSTTMIPYINTDGVPRRRRISISNGQIGQIINHEAFFDSDGGSSPYDDLIPNQNQPSSAPINNLSDNTNTPAVESFGLAQPAINQPPAISQQPIVNGGGATSFPPVSRGELSNNSFADAAGVPPPNHQLIYNNEVIYNPNNGPIPGTAAWKKKRLLERNRIAASKCRQRKKQAQQELQDNNYKFEVQITNQQNKIKKYALLTKKYNYKMNLLLLELKNRNLSQINIAGIQKLIAIDNIDNISFDELNDL